jgi:hypothetical protein
MGHSAGSLATFRIATDPRLTTTVHLSGGTFPPHAELANLRKPAAFMCGDAGGDGLLVGDIARPNCDYDFQNAQVPVFYGNPLGASHMSVTGAATDPLTQNFMAATAAWLRWQLSGDAAPKTLFTGASCELCRDPAWGAEQKNLQ